MRTLKNILKIFLCVVVGLATFLLIVLFVVMVRLGFSSPVDDVSRVINPIPSKTVIVIADVDNNKGFFSGKPSTEITLSEKDFSNKNFGEVFVSHKGCKLVFWGFQPNASTIFRYELELKTKGPVAISSIENNQKEFLVYFSRSLNSVLVISSMIMLATVLFASFTFRLFRWSRGIFRRRLW